MATKTYPVDVVLSVASGKMLCADFTHVQMLVTDLAGWPVMTHHMANRELMDAVTRKVIQQVPWMPAAIENMPTFPKGPEAEQPIRAYVADLALWVGPTVELGLGEPLEPLSLFAGLEHLGAGEPR